MKDPEQKVKLPTQWQNKDTPFSLVPVVKRKWVEALRSKRYSQGTGSLRMEQGYCCLGVLCDVFKDETGQGTWESHSYITKQENSFSFDVDKNSNEDFSFNLDRESKEIFPPEIVAEWTLGTAVSDSETLWEWFSQLNDTEEYSFNEIADVIEQDF